jgi:hypothetical protein
MSDSLCHATAPWPATFVTVLGLLPVNAFGRGSAVQPNTGTPSVRFEKDGGCTSCMAYGCCDTYGETLKRI